MSNDQLLFTSSTEHEANSKPAKKKRNLPGNPDPESEVIALSPRTLMATNRFICEVCKKGFQRDQNLQLHRRGHNLPWKLKQRAAAAAAPPGGGDHEHQKMTVAMNKKKVYVCPVESCVHHHPCRALGDLAGIKKHFSRKHGEKKYKCDKCCKKYAVQSDWKAHSKTCGLRQYKCDCGTIFSRRDSFTTHKAFCDALAQKGEKVLRRANPTHATTFANITCSNNNIIHDHHDLLFSPDDQYYSTTFDPRSTDLQAHQLKTSVGADEDHEDCREITLKVDPQQQVDEESHSMWLQRGDNFSSYNEASYPLDHHFLLPSTYSCQTPPPPSSLSPAAAAFPHLSATALLQKAAEMGATVGNGSSSADHHHHHTQSLMAAHDTSSTSTNYLRKPPCDLLLQEMLMMSRLSPASAINSDHHHQELTRDFLGLKEAFSSVSTQQQDDLFGFGMAAGLELEPCMRSRVRASPSSFDK